MNPIQGLHHITAIASDPQKNLRFYHRVLGQRLVKKTVNFDDPGTYHLYYGDETGTPGTIMTFFPWPYASRGRAGTGETSTVAYRIPKGSLEFWRSRLESMDITPSSLDRFGESVLALSDPDGMAIELIETEIAEPVKYWSGGGVPEEHAIQGFHGVTLRLDDVEATASLLTEYLGYEFAEGKGNRSRFTGASAGSGRCVDLLEMPHAAGRFGAGSIHHIAFRTVDDDEQLEYQAHVRTAGLQVTPVQDRQYFHSIYFREPGGVLFEVATDAPGFDYDEPVDRLGSALKLPTWLEPRRSQIESVLPELDAEM